MSQIETSTIVFDIFYIGVTGVLVDGMHYFATQITVFCLGIWASANTRHFVI